MITQRLILIDPPEDSIPLHYAEAKIWACAGCRAVIASSDERGVRAISHQDDCPDMAAIRAAERERIYAELGSDHHVIFTEDGWTTEHSVECRLSGQMHQCAYHTAVAAVADEPRPEMAGRWRIAGIDSSGLPILQPADPIGPTP